MSISGKFIVAKVGSSPVALIGNQSWSAEDSVQELDGATAESEGYEDPDAGLQSVSVSMMMVIDITTGSLTPLQAGTVLTDLGLYADAEAEEPIYDIPTFLVLKSTPKGEIGGRFTYDVSGKSKGPYTLNDPN